VAVGDDTHGGTGSAGMGTPPANRAEATRITRKSASAPARSRLSLNPVSQPIALNATLPPPWSWVA
jgi:hypothetical protein